MSEINSSESLSITITADKLQPVKYSWKELINRITSTFSEANDWFYKHEKLYEILINEEATQLDADMIKLKKLEKAVNKYYTEEVVPHEN